MTLIYILLGLMLVYYLPAFLYLFIGVTRAKRKEGSMTEDERLTINFLYLTIFKVGPGILYLYTWREFKDKRYPGIYF